MIGATSGGLGDIIYSIPVMHKLGVHTLYVKESYYYPPYGNLYSAITSLLHVNGINALPTAGSYPPHKYDPNIKFDIDFDFARKQRNRRNNHIILSYLNTWHLDKTNWNKPWLKVIGEHDLRTPYTVIHRTNRWRKDSRVKWKKILEGIENPVFVGFWNEYHEFISEYPVKPVIYYPTQDILDLACVIRDAKALYCNQSVSLTIAQGLGKEYYLEKNPKSTNTIMNTENEHIL